MHQKSSNESFTKYCQSGSQSLRVNFTSQKAITQVKITFYLHRWGFTYPDKLSFNPIIQVLWEVRNVKEEEKFWNSQRFLRLTEWRTRRLKLKLNLFHETMWRRFVVVKFPGFVRKLMKDLTWKWSWLKQSRHLFDKKDRKNMYKSKNIIEKCVVFIVNCKR